MMNQTRLIELKNNRLAIKLQLAEESTKDSPNPEVLRSLAAMVLVYDEEISAAEHDR